MLSVRLSNTSFVQYARMFSKKKDKYLARELRAREQAEAQRLELEKLPKFSSLIRQFYKRSHPDLLRASHPEYAQINDQSMQILNDVITTIKSVDKTQKLLIKKIPFYMKTTGSTEVTLIEMNLKSMMMKRSFEQFFIASKISEDGVFVWDKDFYPVEVIDGPRAEEPKANTSDAVAV